MRAAHLIRLALVLHATTACVVQLDPGATIAAGSAGMERAELSQSARGHRLRTIRDAAAAHGMTNGALLAGIADAETGLAHCWAEATWACQGPHAAECGGAIIAGSGDGACSQQQGALGLFQFDGGTYQQTLVRDGEEILSVVGSTQRAVQFAVGMVIGSAFVPDVGNSTEAIAWMNSVPVEPGDARYEAWISTVTRHYNGCSPSMSCWASRRAAYDARTRAVFHEGGGAPFWGSPAPIAPPVAGPGSPPGAAGPGGHLAASFGRVGRNADGRLEVFVRGAGGSVRHRWQQGPSGAGGWGDWADLGGVTTHEPVVGATADGRLEVFARGADGAVWHAWQEAQNAPFSSWASLGGDWSREPVVASNNDGRLELFARGRDDELYIRWQTWPALAFSEEWASLGGTLRSQPAVARNADGRLEVFVIGADGALWHRWQLGPGLGWDEWARLGGGPFVGDVVLGQNGDGRLEVFARTDDGSLKQAWQLWPNGSWSEFVASGPQLSSAPIVARNADGRVEVFGVGTDASLWHSWQNHPDLSWSGWHSLGGDLRAQPLAAQNADGRLELFALGADDQLWLRWQTAPSSGWSEGWVPFGR